MPRSPRLEKSGIVAPPHVDRTPMPKILRAFRTAARIAGAFLPPVSEVMRHEERDLIRFRFLSRPWWC
jgi:hypothetical protein